MRRKIVLLPLLVLCAGLAVFFAARAAPAVARTVRLRRHWRDAIRKESAVTAAWNREFGEPAAILARYPKQPDDETLNHLVGLARGLGIELTRPSGGPEKARSSPRNADRELHKAIGDYVEARLRTVSGPIAAPEKPVAEYLRGHTESLDQVVQDLLESPPPRWPLDLSRWPDSPVPNLLGPLLLQRVLIAEALSSESSGSPGNIDRILQASWNLNAGLRDRPELISQLVAITVARLQAGLIRRAEVDPARWRPRLIEHDYRASLLASLEAWAVLELRDLGRDDSSFMRASRVDLLDLKRRMLVALRDSPVSDGDGREIGRQFPWDADPLSAGGFVFAEDLPEELGSIRRVDRLILDTELTGKILEVRELRRKLGRWPREIPGIESSRIRDAHWIYSVTPEGRMSIAISRPMQWGKTVGLVLPVRYESD